MQTRRRGAARWCSVRSSGASEDAGGRRRGCALDGERSGPRNPRASVSCTDAGWQHGAAPSGDCGPLSLWAATERQGPSDGRSWTAFRSGGGALGRLAGCRGRRTFPGHVAAAGGGTPSGVVSSGRCGPAEARVTAGALVRRPCRGAPRSARETARKNPNLGPMSPLAHISGSSDLLTFFSAAVPYGHLPSVAPLD